MCVCVCVCPRGETRTLGGPEKGDGLWVVPDKTDRLWMPEDKDGLWMVHRGERWTLGGLRQETRTLRGPQTRETDSEWSTDERETRLLSGPNLVKTSEVFPLQGAAAVCGGTPLYPRNRERNDL